MSGRLSDKVGFRVTVTNGEGINGKDKNSAKSTSGRLTFDVGSNSRLHTYAVFDETVDQAGDTRWAPAYALEYELGTWRQGPLLVANVATGRNWKAEDAAVEDHDRVGFVAFQAMGLWYLPIEGDGAFEAFEPLFRVSWASTQTGPSLFEGDIIVNDDVTGLVITPGFMLYATGRTGISTNLDIYSSSARIVARLEEARVDADPDRLAQEMVMFASRADVAEELDRLDAHVTEVHEALASGSPIGRRLDFLMQELQREANTLGSKSADPDTSRASVDLKVLIEQMREQVQNIE